ncbi:hypothetical protein BVU76_21675 [Mycolicibacterium porcinum]|nr:hypothetical protein BVU76_21675 [Mycolicibacterium porcinum]
MRLRRPFCGRLRRLAVGASAVAIARSFDVQPRTAAWYVQLCRRPEYGLLVSKPGDGRKKA